MMGLVIGSLDRPGAWARLDRLTMRFGIKRAMRNWDGRTMRAVNLRALEISASLDLGPATALTLSLSKGGVILPWFNKLTMRGAADDAHACWYAIIKTVLPTAANSAPLRDPQIRQVAQQPILDLEL